MACSLEKWLQINRHLLEQQNVKGKSSAELSESIYRETACDLQLDAVNNHSSASCFTMLSPGGNQVQKVGARLHFNSIG